MTGRVASHDATGAAPLSATRRYSFSATVQGDGARAIVIPVAFRGSWDDYGVEERPEQAGFVRRALERAGIEAVGRYPGEWVFPDDAALDAAWRALVSQLHEPAPAPPVSEVTRDVAASEVPAVEASLVARACAVASALSRHAAASFVSTGATLDTRRAPPLRREVFRCEDVWVAVESSATPDGGTRVVALVDGVAAHDGVRAELHATLGPSGGALRAVVAGVLDAADVARLFVG